MGHRRGCSSLVALAILAGLAVGSAQFDSTLFDTSGFGFRRLSAAYYQHNFVAVTKSVSCYQSSYFSPYRVVATGVDYTTNPDEDYWFLQVGTVACQVPSAFCCNEQLDHLVIRTVPTASVLRVELGGDAVPAADVTVDKEGLTIRNVGMYPTAVSLNITIVTPSDAYNDWRDLCPDGRFPNRCDFIAYNKEETCCLQRVAPLAGVDPNIPDLNATTKTPPSPKPKPSPKPSPHHSPPRSPPKPPSPPPPPPDGETDCCINDISKSPFKLKYQGSKRTGSDTAYSFQLWFDGATFPYPDFDGPESGDCSKMSLRDVGIAIYDDLLIKEVIFNGTVHEYWTEATGVEPDAVFLYVEVEKTYRDFNQAIPIDLVITVRGKVDSLCPANDYLHSNSACEYVFHGRDDESQCCPHGATRRGPEPDECCVDDMEKSPYRIEYGSTSLSEQTTTYDFYLKVVDVTGKDYDLPEAEKCDRMTLDSAQVQIYEHIDVLDVRWGDRYMDFNITKATDYSAWLNIHDINRFVTDFDTNVPIKFSITVRGYIRELCPAGWMFGASGVVCEYALHGVQGNHTCCPHAITASHTNQTTPGTDCGCRDDLALTPYRLGYSLAGAGDGQTVFNFDLGRVDPDSLVDVDGDPDRDATGTVSCRQMSISSVSFAIDLDVQIKDVVFNGYNYTWQYEAYTATSKWLRVLDIDYKLSDVPSNKALPLQVVAKGKPTELCSSSSLFHSQASCEYVVYGTSEGSDCCPHSVTTWTTISLFAATR